jgi:hypothetical protein
MPETTETMCCGEETHPPARSMRRGLHVTLLTILNLDRLQVHCKWEISGKSKAREMSSNATNPTR